MHLDPDVVRLVRFQDSSRVLRWKCCSESRSCVGICVDDRGRAWADEGGTLGPDRHARDIGSLDRYATERWEVILHFMVGSPCAAVSQDLAQLLVHAGLMKRYRY